MRNAGSVAGRLAAVSITTLLGAVAAPLPAAAQEAEWWHSTWQLPEVQQVTDGGGTTVAVVDTGVDMTVPDLADALVPGMHVAEQSDGRVDSDPDRHGTGVASLIASRGADSGLVGIAPSTTILPIANLDPDGIRPDRSTVENFATSIRYAADHDVDVINISQVIEGSEECPAAVGAAVRHAVSQDVIVVAGSGNVADGPSRPPGACPGVITVGAIGSDLEPWEHSHRSEHVDLVAPGVDVAVIGPEQRVQTVQGTSFATALVSGAAALIRAAYPEASADEVVTRLLATARDLGEPGRDDATGYGLVQPLAALTEPVPPDAPNPIYEGLDLTDTDDPAPSPPSELDFEAPPVAGADDSDGPPVMLFAALGGGLLLLLLFAVVAALLVVRATRRASRPN